MVGRLSLRQPIYKYEEPSILLAPMCAIGAVVRMPLMMKTFILTRKTQINMCFCNDAMC